MHHFDIAPEVATALAEGRPVVALESSLVAHGLPYPRSVEAAAAMASAIADEGAVASAVGVVAGRIRVGLTAGEIDRLATTEAALKLSRRDLAYAVAAGRDGGTTVAATMACARLAGIAVFATGGIGGVHRGVEATMDVSADLDELGRTPVAVVCAGAKAILDLPRTLEALETRGVPVIGFATDAFPAFYCRHSGLPAPARLDDAEAVARLMAAHWGFGDAGGILIANPPPEATAMDRDEVEDAIRRALREAELDGVTGGALTPYLLERVAELTAGGSLAANMALLEHNARLAARIAVAYGALASG